MSWTSTSQIKGYRHFVAINYGGKDLNRWISLVSVLDGKVRFTVLWSEIKDPSKWNAGWLKSSREVANPDAVLKLREQSNQSIESKSCLHPSEDSGLMIPSEQISIRSWF